MVQGSSSVVVTPRDWEGSVDELARKMMPITRRSPAQVIPLLARGPMTIEADLSQAEAERLHGRLRALGVPAQIVKSGEEIIESSTQEPPRRRSSTALGAPFVREPTPVEMPVMEALGEGVLDEPDEDKYDEIGWEEAFEELSELDSSIAVEEISEVSGLSEESFEDVFDHVFETDSDFGAEPAPPEMPAQASREEAESLASESALESPKVLDVAPGFDTTHMSDALLGEEKPPYAPDGFDDRVEHIPALAALLSALAPGAGQIYNGEEARVRDLCRRSVWVRPWVDSVAQARKTGEKIRDYWAPRPKEGALGRALKHLAIFWVLAAVVLGGFGWAGSAIYRVATAPQASTIPEVDPAEVVERAKRDLIQAQALAIAAQEAEAQAVAERAKKERFTMPDEERAERLFRQGYAYCESGRYRTCATAMRRVSELSPKLRRKAFRLQAWAEIRQSGDQDAPMPDVGEVESLSGYEMMMLSSEPE